MCCTYKTPWHVRVGKRGKKRLQRKGECEVDVGTLLDQTRYKYGDRAGLGTKRPERGAVNVIRAYWNLTGFKKVL